MMVKIGDPITFKPDAFVAVQQAGRGGTKTPVRVTGRVAWIHPQKRFLVAEATVNGVVIRETVPIAKRKGGC